MKRLISVVIVLIFIFGSFNVIGLKNFNSETKENCGCNKQNKIINQIKDPDRPKCLGQIVVPYDQEPYPCITMQFSGNNPESWDWRDVDGKDYTTPIRNQEECGSCWAFGAVATLESFMEIKKNNPDLNPDLSEQYLVSCGMSVLPNRLDGCCGAYITATMFFLKHFGTVTEPCFEYVAVDAKGRDAWDCGEDIYAHEPVECTERCFGWRTQLHKIGDYGTLADLFSIKHVISNYGPVVAGFMVYEDFFSYEGGIYERNSDIFLGGHIISIVGYNDNLENPDEPGYWICKNSWGSSWGENGYFRIKYGECSIDEEGHCFYFENFKISKSYQNNRFFQIIERIPIIKYLFYNSLLKILS